ncbi:MAG: translation initiation factor IF-3 [Pirellulales bacterium]
MVRASPRTFVDRPSRTSHCRGAAAERPSPSNTSILKRHTGTLHYSNGRIKPIERQQRINEQIRISPVRVIGATGEQFGIMPTDEAMSRAREAGLDLVEVASQERPPVVRIMDFGKFKYQQRKRQHKGQVHHSKIKEIRLRPKIGDHDLEFKLTHAREFLTNRDKVTVAVVFRGREIAHTDEGRRVIDRVIAKLDDIAKVEQAPMHQGRRIVCTLAPR